MLRRILALIFVFAFLAGCNNSYDPEYNNDDLAKERGEGLNFFQRLFSSPRPERDARYSAQSTYAGFKEDADVDYGSHRNELTSDLKVVDEENK